MSANRMFEMLGLDTVQVPSLIDEQIRLPSRHLARRETTPAASPDDEIARQAVAKIEGEDGFDACAENRLRGAYDGDAEHRIALAAIRLARDLIQSRKERQ